MWLPLGLQELQLIDIGCTKEMILIKLGQLNNEQTENKDTSTWEKQLKK